MVINATDNRHLHLTSSRQVAHKASTLCRQPALSAAVVDTSLQIALSLSLLLCCSPLCCRRSTPLPVPFWCPRHCSPTGIVISFPHLSDERSPSLLPTSSLRFPLSAISGTSLLMMLSWQRILNIHLRHLFWKTSTLFPSLLFIFHVSQPYIKTGLTSLV